MTGIETQNPMLLTDLDVNYEPFHCCGDEDLVFIKCPSCQHLMVFCYECDTLYPQLGNLAIHYHVFTTHEMDRLNCPHCHKPFPDFHFLRPPMVDKYLVTQDEVIEKGFVHLLAKHRRSS